jgi:MFS family permease
VSNTLQKKNIFSLYRGLGKSVYVLFIATVCNAMGSFVYPFLILLLTQRLGYSEVKAGLFMTLTAVVYLPGSLIGGKLTDHYGRKTVMVISQIVALSMFVICGFIGDSPFIPLYILFNLFFDGITDPARSALLTDVTNSENRQASFSFNYLGHNLGFAFGPIVAGLFFYTHPQWIFFGNAIASAVAVGFVMMFVPESKPSQSVIEQSKNEEGPEKSEEGGLLKALLARPHLLLYGVCATFYSFAYSQALFALPLYTTSLFGKGGAALYGRMMSVNALVVIVSNSLLVVTLRRFHPLRNIAIAGLFYAVGFTLLGWAHSPLFLYLLSVVYTIGEVIDATNNNFYVANNTPLSHRGRFSSFFPLLMGVGHAIAPAVGGLLSSRYNLHVVWLSVGVSALIGSGGTFFLYMRDLKKPIKVVNVRNQ